MAVPNTVRAMTTGKLEIPINGTDEVIELDISNLPEAQEVLDILRREAATLGTWSSVALEYYRVGREDDYLQIMQAGQSEARINYKDSAKDKMLVLDSLAAYYAKLGMEERDRERRQFQFLKATTIYAAGDRVIMYDLNHLLGRANFCLLEGERLDQADSQFSFIIANQTTSIAALLGKGCIAYTKKDYRSAQAFFRKALRTNPGTTAEVRMCLGMCLLKLGHAHSGEARIAFLRALELNPKCVPAMIGLAVYYLNQATLETVKWGVQLFSKAYVFDPNNPMVLNHLANHFFFRRELDKAYQLAIHAFRATEHEGLRAESCFQLARVLHFRHEYDQAFQYYYQATQYAGTGYVLPYFGLGQMYIQRNDIENAALCFERVLKAEPENYESMKILGSLYGNYAPTPDSDAGEAKRELARTYLRKVTAKQPHDVEAWTELAALLEPVDVAESLRCYMTVVRLHGQELHAPVPVDILNNIGALHYRLGNHAEARQYFEETLRRATMEFSSVGVNSGMEEEVEDREKIENGNDGQMRQMAVAVVAFSCISVTASYNLARLEEACCNFGKAEVIYKDILRQHPNYFDCYLRLGCIARDKGNIYEASDWFKEALQLSNEHPDAWTLIGNLHLSKAEWQPAQKKFERILNGSPETAHDSYALIALANIWLHTLSFDKAKEARHQERALSIYKQVLRNDPKNIWAANGVGAVLAKKGYWNEARDVFAQVREATADFQDVCLNIAHVYVEQRQYIAAVRMYENCIKKFCKHHPADILQFLARAHLKNGKLQEAKIALLRARRVAPFDLVLLYNLAFILQRIAVQALRDDKSNLASVLAAVRDLTQANAYFQFLAGEGAGGSTAAAGGARPKYNVVSAGAEARQCRDLLAQSAYHVARARKADEEERLQRRRQEEEREAARRAHQAEAKTREEEKKRREEELLRKREEFKEQRKSAVLFIETPPPEPKALRGKKGGGKKGVGGDSDGSGPGGGEDAHRNRRRRGHPRQKSGSGGTRGRRPKCEEDRRGRIVSRELISSSENSSDVDDSLSGAESEREWKYNEAPPPVDDLPDPKFTSSSEEESDAEAETEGAGKGKAPKPKVGFRGFECVENKMAAALAEETLEIIGVGRRSRKALIISSSDSEDGPGGGSSRGVDDYR